MNFPRCGYCNSELSQCGVPDLSGEPTLDCEVCKLRGLVRSYEHKIKRLEIAVEKLVDVIAAGVRENELYEQEIAAAKEQSDE